VTNRRPNEKNICYIHQSATIRLALADLRTSPTLSLCAEAAVPPLQFRFLYHSPLTSQHPRPSYFKILSFSPLFALKTLFVSPLKPTWANTSDYNPCLLFIHPFLLGHLLHQLSDSTWLPYPDLPTQHTTGTLKPSSLMNFPLIPSVIQMDPNQEPEHATHFPSMASSPTTASGTLPPYFRLNYLPSIPASLIFLSFPLHINSSSFPFPRLPPSDAGPSFT